MNRLRTGIRALDRNIDGGVPEGSLIVVRTDPSTQGEVLLKQLTEQRSSLYISTTRTESDVKDWLGESDDVRVQYTALETPIESIKQNVGMVEKQANIIIDCLNPVEREEYAKYLSMLQVVKNHIANTGSIAVLHVLDEDHTPDHRAVTMQMADMVLDISQRRNGSDLNTRLAVTKCRSGILPAKVSKVDLGSRVTVDTSRDIA